jgi:hypothetical protein
VNTYAKRQSRYTPVRGRRAEFAMVELRRREYLGEAASTAHAASRPRAAGTEARVGATAARFGAGAALLATTFVLGLSLGMALSTQPEDLALAHHRAAQPKRMQSRAMQSRPMQSRALERGSLIVSIPRTADDATASLAFATHEGFFGPATRDDSRPQEAGTASAGTASAGTASGETGSASQRTSRPQAVANGHVSSGPAVAFAPGISRPQEAGTASPATATSTRAHSGDNGFSMEAQPWRLTADGAWTTEVSAVFADAAGERQPQLHAAVDFQTSSGEPVPLDPWIHQSPAALVAASGGEGVTVTAVSGSPIIGSATLELPPPPNGLQDFASVAHVVGPHLIAVGWTPLAPSAGVQQYKVYRHAPDGVGQMLVSVVSPRGHSWRDTHVSPGASYQYSVVAQLPSAVVSARTKPVQTPQEMTVASLDAIAGKGMFLFFSPDATDLNSYEQFDPDAVIAQAQRAGVSEIELRLSRGTFFEAASPQAREWLDGFIDTASAAGIKLLAWTVPRRNTAEDVAQSVAMATYRTPAGNGFAGLALDLEPGAQYMGNRSAARERMADYMEMIRQAVGPDYLLVATVISPRLTHWTNDDYPYSRIARYASAMQPMEYWHHYRGGHDYAQTAVSGQCADAVALTRSLAGRDVPVNVAGQSADLGRTGAPSPEELHWCLGAAKSAGAIGEMFFNWRATTPDQWAAIEAYRW